MAIGVLALVSPLAACSNDDTSSATREPDTSATDSTAGATTTAAFCKQAFTTDTAVSAAMGGEQPDDAAIDTAEKELTQLKETATDDITDIAEAVAASTAKMLTAPGPPSEEFTTSFAGLTDWMSDNCGYQVVDVEAQEYAFSNLPAELESGPTIVRLTNHGKEVHEIAFAKRKEGTTKPVDQLLALPEDQVDEKVEFLSGGFAMPDASGAALLDLSAGDYIAVCFIPVGTTAETMASLDGPPADAMPHAMQGMTGEFTVR